MLYLPYDTNSIYADLNYEYEQNKPKESTIFYDCYTYEYWMWLI